MKKLVTLCIVHNPTHILLGMKKYGFGEGRWSGFGGKVERGETIEAAAKRELIEEAGITPLDMKKRGVLRFHYDKGKDVQMRTLEVHVFSVSHFSDEPVETNEMIPQWFAHKDTPFHAMWPDDPHWLPLLLAGKHFQGEFHFKGYDTILRHVVTEV